MAYLQEFRDALRARVCAVWPEAAEHGVWLAVQIERFPFQEFAEEGKLPLAVMQLRLSPSDEYGIANAMETGNITITYVDTEAGPETAEDLLLKGEALRDALWPASDALAMGQVLDYPEVRCDEEIPANVYFLNRNLPFLAASVSFPVVVGEEAGA